MSIDDEVSEHKLRGAIEYDLKRILEPYSFGKLQIDRDRLLAFTLELIISAKPPDSLGDLRLKLICEIGKQLLKQLGEKPK